MSSIQQLHGADDDVGGLAAQTHFKDVAELVNHVSLWLTPQDVLAATTINKKWRSAILWDGYEDDKQELKVWDGELQEIEYSRDTFRPFGYWTVVSVLLYLLIWITVFGVWTAAGRDADLFSRFITAFYTLGVILTVPTVLLGLLFCVKGSLKFKLPVALLMVVLFPINFGLVVWFSYGADIKAVVEQQHVDAASELPMVWNADGTSATCRKETPSTILIENPSDWRTPNADMYLDNGGTWKGPTYSGLQYQYWPNHGFPAPRVGSPWDTQELATMNSTKFGRPTAPRLTYELSVFGSSSKPTKVYVYNPFPVPFRSSSNVSDPPTIDLSIERSGDPDSTVIVLLYQRNGQVQAFDPANLKPPKGFAARVRVSSPGINSIYTYGAWDVTFSPEATAGDSATDVVQVAIDQVDVIRSRAETVESGVSTQELERQMYAENNFQIRDLCSSLFQQTYEAVAIGQGAEFSNFSSPTEAAATSICFNTADVSGVCTSAATVPGRLPRPPKESTNGTRSFPSSNNPCITPTITLRSTRHTLLSSSGNTVRFPELPQSSIVYVHGESYWLHELLDDKGGVARKEPFFHYAYGRSYHPTPMLGVAIEPGLATGAQVYFTVSLILLVFLFVMYLVALLFTFSRSRKINQVFHAEQRMEEQKQRWRLKRKFPPHKLIRTS